MIPEKNATGRVEQAFSLMFKHWKDLLTFPFIITLLTGLGGVLIMKINSAMIVVTSILFIILSIIGGMLAMISVIHNISQIYKGKDCSFDKTFEYSKNHFGHYFSVIWKVFLYTGLIPLILFILVVGIVLVASDFVVLVPFISFAGGLYFFIKTLRAFLAVYIAIDNEKNAKDSLDLSIKLTENRNWQTLGNFLLLGIISALIGYIYKFATMPLIGSNATSMTLESLSIGMIFLSVLAGATINAFNTVFGTVFVFLLYKIYTSSAVKTK